MHYAIKELHFNVKNIVIYGWSLGGYAACWAAAHYQDIRGIIVDAIFDDIVPLAQKQMPKFTSKFVEKTIRYFLDLNNIQLLKLYKGPFYLIRRTNDEVMNFIPGKVASNCANTILFFILPYRYPYIYNDTQIIALMKKYICSNKVRRQSLFDKYCADMNYLRMQTDKYRERNPIVSYPCNFGLYLNFEIK